MTDPGQNDKNSNGVEIKRSLPPTPRAAKVFYRRGVPPTTSLSREVCSVLANLMLQSSHLPAGGDRKSVKALNEHFFFLVLGFVQYVLCTGQLPEIRVAITVGLQRMLAS